ncbi:type III-B CRISPR module RAMP protein Cmr6 [Candidatus Methanocrinis natronophilus]|uniref:Type III-B CRISPR module RAMP protein Cmr6 n=1 Tax=Candidatus Methanocrinis natronophilus TaxID=3033396 RepID=A0ABT5X4P6_9EURY|nr:type III-B CRISPR module RAMP protein Cmr6 [Candidatus Methanocrinis natronophilus]MDF0589661.1 type III-B CRISPR module RAMP protein Cmr6 [Candidatus Methanocrinis natronophilus]
MADTCRERISNWWEQDHQTGSNAGLLRDKYLRAFEVEKGKNDTKARSKLFDAMRQSLVQSESIYHAAYERRLITLPEPRAEGIFTTKGRMVIGLGSESVMETGITLQRTYGTPLIPGEALKGLASHYCDQVLGTNTNDQTKGFKKFKEGFPGGQYHKAIFGTTEDSGHIIFHDAWISPDTLVDSLQLDVMTPHHRYYYSDESGSTPPTDFDDPNPVTFLSVIGTFHIAVSCDVPGEEGQKWADLAFEMLSDALRDWGIGGKTNAGYGRLLKGDEISASRISQTNVSGEQVPSKVSKPQIQGPRYKKGMRIEVTREADPKAQRGRAYFKADDGFGGFVQSGDPPSLDIRQKTFLEIAGVMDEGYVFRVPGSRDKRDDRYRKKGKGGRK